MWNMVPARIDKEFTEWLRATADRKGLSRSDVLWAFPFQVHPKTIEAWFGGRARPGYREFVGLCVALGELPPVLQELADRASS